MTCYGCRYGLQQPRSQALSPIPPLSSTTREEKERGTGNEVGLAAEDLKIVGVSGYFGVYFGV